MKTSWHRLFPFLIVVLLVAGQPSRAASQESMKPGPSPAAHPDTAAPGQALQPLQSFLRPDGTLNLQTGVSGSLDPRGWAMVSEPGQPPRFVRASDPVGTVADAGPDAPTVAGDEFWDNRFDVLGVTGYVRAIAVSGSDVYVGGNFSAVGGVAANNIAKWNSTTGTWSTLGNGGTNGVSGDVYAIAVSGSDVYAGGLFGAAGGVAANDIARWDSTTGTWSALSSGLSNGVSSYVYAIAVSGNDVYVGGLFAGIGGVSSVAASNIAKWNSVTHTWSALGGGVSGYVYAIAVSGSDIYVGGQFTAAGGYPSVLNTVNIAKWNGNSWSALGSGVAGYVYAIAVSGSDVYVGGLFNAASNVPNTQNIAKWNGSSWSALGSGVSSDVYAIAVSGSDVYVGGLFNAASSVSNTVNIAKWNGSSWSALGSGVSGYVYDIALGTDGVYVGGLFNTAGGKASRNFGLWHGNIANPPNPNDVYWDSRFAPNALGLDRDARAIATSGNDVYVGGTFTSADGEPNTANIARWNSTLGAWSAVGGGLPGWVDSVAVSGNDVYALYCVVSGGSSTQILARWNGSSWSVITFMPTCGYPYVYISVLAVSGSDLYVGGFFPSIGTVSANNIAKWNGLSWSVLVSGTVNGVTSNYPAAPSVAAIAVAGNQVFVGGSFDHAGGASANNIAVWNGNSWSSLGGGVTFGYPNTGWVSAIAIAGSDVYVGGGFNLAGGLPVNNIAKWNGSTWSALGAGITGTVRAIAMNGSDVYVGGSFNTAGDASANGVAKWDGTKWSALGSGVTDSFGNAASVGALAVGVDGIYVGGGFRMAGGKPSNYFGLWHANIIAPLRGSISGRVFDPNSNPVPAARVQVCQTGGGACFWTGVTDSQGNYVTTGLPDGRYKVTANPPASSNLLPSTIGPLTIANGVSLTGQNIYLQANQPPPPGTSISPIEGIHGGIPSVHWKKHLQLVTNGCPGGTASYQILQNDTVIRSGPMTESPPPPGRYQGTIDPLYPHNGYATIHITIQCPDNSTQTRDFSIYIDPSGTVRTIHGTPVMSATVTLAYFNEVTGTFTIVPDSDAIMSPANRTNPDLTDAEGHFGWDVIAGFYKVRAEKAGCVSPNNPDQPYVESEILVVPPPVTDLDLRLDCGEQVVYLPLIQR